MNNISNCMYGLEIIILKLHFLFVLLLGFVVGVVIVVVVVVVVLLLFLFYKNI